MKKYNPILNIELPSLINTQDLKLLGYLPKIFCDLEDKKVIQSNQSHSNYILKYSLDELESFSENEHFFLWLAQECDLNVSENLLIKHENSFMLLSKRFDIGKKLIHLSDLFKKEERILITLEKIYSLVDELNQNIISKEDIKKEIFKQFLFSNTIGNYDLHSNNIAFLINIDGSLNIAPAYDIVCTQARDDSTRSAIKVNNKSKDVEASDIIEVSKNFLDAKWLLNTSSHILLKIKNNLSELDNSYINLEDMGYIKDYISLRLEKLTNTLSQGNDFCLNEIVSNYEKTLESSLTLEESKELIENHQKNLKSHLERN